MKTTIYSVFAIMLSASGLMACSDDDFGPDPAKNWAETTTFFAPTDDAGFNTYFMPAIGRVGDPMPFYDKKAGEFKVLYLQEFDNNYAQDAALGTGCAVYNEKEGLYYLYYTGHNGNCSSREVVLRATSPDFKTWTKDVAWSIKGVEYGYSGNDFRDPQIFTTDDGVYHMVISTYPSWGGDPKFAEFKSNDMKTWEHVGMFNMIWDRMLECPDIFKMGNYWYLVFSQSNRAAWSRKVKYMVATSWEGLKDCFNSGPKWPADGPLLREGTLDTRAFYAAKTASNGTDRYIWGWSPYRSGKDIHEKNINVGADGEPNWSGALVCHKIIQHEDGTLTLGAVPAIAAKYTKQQPVNVMASNGYNNGTLSGEGAYVLYNRLGTCNHITFTVKTAGDADKFGVSFVRDTDAKKYYTMMVNPEENGTARKVNFEQEGPEGKGYIDGADGYGFYRPADNTYKVDIYTDNSVVVMYINDNVCSTQRIYGIQKNCWSINNYGGSITVSDVKVGVQ